MNLTTDDKVLKLLCTVSDYKFNERRTGVYDALREILKSQPDIRVPDPRIFGIQ